MAKSSRRKIFTRRRSHALSSAPPRPAPRPTNLDEGNIFVHKEDVDDADDGEDDEDAEMVDPVNVTGLSHVGSSHASTSSSSSMETNIANLTRRIEEMCNLHQ
ncbi:hypothetical protein LR48_Vigan07g237300 [Vigna angularis]|uniref:Uncharacterized protein n=1 Tax=Phaseolus angularis TaxID=3914 RepID=A0A0L9V1N7_PHAAN|nr:hypothetical protein LR48_Vigan07g237300 [Vigna angularis]